MASQPLILTLSVTTGRSEWVKLTDEMISVIKVYQGLQIGPDCCLAGTTNCSLQSVAVTRSSPHQLYRRGPTIKLVKYLGQFLCPQPSGMGRLLDQVTGCKDHKHTVRHFTVNLTSQPRVESGASREDHRHSIISCYNESFSIMANSNHNDMEFL